MIQTLTREKESVQINVELEKVNCCVCNSDEYKEIATGQDYEYGTISGIFIYNECKKCGHLYLNPRPTLRSGPDLYSTYYTTTEKSNSIKRNKLVEFLAKKVMLSRIKPLLAYLPKGGSVLEIGFGNGDILSALRDIRTDINIYGIDIKINPLTRKLLEEKKIKLFECSFESYKEEGLKADLIIMNQLIEHFWDTNSSIKKIQNILNKNGRVVVATPNSRGYDRNLFSKGAWGQYYWPRHMNLFNLKPLSNLFKKYGLETEKVSFLVCPVGWAQTTKYLTYRLGFKKLSSKINTYNPILLAIFTLVDLFAKSFGLETSNMQIVFKKH
jgi:ubiquinone/menaquinone biosynthesis C-methylase UbiE